MLLYPDPEHPYYIVTPPYTRNSAGIRCLHLLCHGLNIRGQIAYILRDPGTIENDDPQTSGADLLTPHLTRAIAETHRVRGQRPIVVYPEIVAGNPYRAPCVVRYILNFPGLLGGDLNYRADELCFGYTAVLARAGHHPENILFIPPIDTRVFKPAVNQQTRTGTCFYAAKYRSLGGDPAVFIADSIEITRDDPAAQSAEDIARLFQSSEMFFTYDNTALAIEAVLCGCPAVFIPNPFLEKIIAVEELGTAGYAWGTDPQEIARATSSVGQGAENYLATIQAFWPQLERFIDRTQDHARQSRSTEAFCFPERPVLEPPKSPEPVSHRKILGMRLPFLR